MSLIRFLGAIAFIVVLLCDALNRLAGGFLALLGNFGSTVQDVATNAWWLYFAALFVIIWGGGNIKKALMSLIVTAVIYAVAKYALGVI